MLKFAFSHVSYVISQRDNEREQRSNNSESLQEQDRVEYKLGRDFRNLSHNPTMVHLHTGIEHLSNAEVEVILDSNDFYCLQVDKCLIVLSEWY